jgi:ABC-2 type transport system ATP-binding protein
VTAVVEFCAVDRDFGQHRAVHDLSFALHAHECVGLVGLNGAGKTTALRMLAGLCAPTRGAIRVRGERMLPDAFALRQNLGFLPERAPLYDAMTVATFLLFAAELRGVPRNERESAVAGSIEATQLSAVRDRRIATLSHGYRQRVGLAQAIVHAPALVILDEPSQGLDPAQSLAMQELVRGLKLRHTVLLSTHLLRDVNACCDRVLLLHEGELIAQGGQAELLARFASGPRCVQIEARGDGEALSRALAAVISVKEVVLTSSAPALLFEVHTEADVRAELSRAVIAAGGDLLGLNAHENGFDAVFAALAARAGALE